MQVKHDSITNDLQLLATKCFAVIACRWLAAALSSEELGLLLEYDAVDDSADSACG